MSDGVLEAPSSTWIVPFLFLDLWGNDGYGHELRRRMTDLGFHEERTREGAPGEERVSPGVDQAPSSH